MRAAMALIWCVAVSDLAAAQPVPRGTVRILVLYGIEPELPVTSAFTRELRSGVTHAIPTHIEFYAEYLDMDRFSDADRSGQLAGYFAEKYKGFRLDAIVAVGGQALQFAMAHHDELFPRVPVVFAMVEAQLVDGRRLAPDITGRVNHLPYPATLALARRLQPDADRLVVIVGTSGTDSLALTAALRDAAPLREQLEVVVPENLGYEDLLAYVRRLPPRTIVLFASFKRDAHGRTFVPAEVVATVARESGAPVYGTPRHWVGMGVVGGATVNPDEDGTVAGRQVVRVLRRREAEPVPPVEYAQSSVVLDWRQLKRWQIDERLVPPDAQILFREPTPWERYRVPIIATTCIAVAEATLIALLLAERRRRIRAQANLADQAAYDQTIAELTTDAVRHAPDEAGRALEDALARLGRYAGASAATLVEYGSGERDRESRLVWRGPHANGNGNGAAHTSVDAYDVAGSRLEVPLVVEGARLGAIELYRDAAEQQWPPRLVERLDAAADVIAGGLARARAMRAIRDGEELNRAVLASLSTQIAILDTGGRIIRVNEAWRQLAAAGGVPNDIDAFVGQSYLAECRQAERRGCADAAEVRSGIEAVLARRASHFQHEYHWSTPDTRWYELRVDCLEYGNGGAIVTHLDVTDRRLAELKAEETRHQIAHMARVALVGELAASISHELRQPLAAIRMNAQVGARLATIGPAHLAELRSIFEDIVADDTRAAEVINHVRGLLRKEDRTVTSVDVNAICQDAARLLHHDAAARHVRLELSLGTHLPPLRGDPVELQQVVLNLALNALDAACSSARERVVRIVTVGRADHIEMSVRDTGTGLTPEVQEHLFDSFFSTKPQGLGLGLAIVRSIVERHNGRISAENADGGGAVFRVVFGGTGPIHAAHRAPPRH